MNPPNCQQVALKIVKHWKGGAISVSTLIGGGLWCPDTFWIALALILPVAIAYVLVEFRRQKSKDRTIRLACEKTLRGGCLLISDGDFSVQIGDKPPSPQGPESEGKP